MKKTVIRALALAVVTVLAFALFAGTVCFAEGEDAEEVTGATYVTEADGSTTSRAIAAAACIALVAAVGALSMARAISKATDGISRQPEADNKIRTTLMLGLVFIETVVIYALIVAILIIFVL